uniref:Core-binding (CB) domain-containing protein n=1 Tax=Esox lucius TaxID=8010 RepID=A0A3P8Y090_ESOLU
VPSDLKRRMPLVCNLCLKSQLSLPQHLERSCMKDKRKVHRNKVVVQAKKEMLEFLWNGRVLDYNSLKAQIGNCEVLLKVVAILEKTGHIITNKSEASPEQTPAEQREEEESEEEDESTEDSSGPKIMSSMVKVRMVMTEKGFYKKHPLDDRLLSGFAKYLKGPRGVKNYKQEIANVSRYLYFMDNTKPSLQFVNDIERTRTFFVTLVKNGLVQQTVANYMKNLKRFMRYITVSRNLHRDNRDLHTEMTAKQPTPAECLEVLTVAKPSFLKIIDKAMCETPLKKDEQRLVLYYLEALLMLKHLQCSGVVKNMTVSNEASVDEGVSPTDTFFVSSTGKMIHNPSNDVKNFMHYYILSKMHEPISLFMFLFNRFNLPSITTRKARQAFEMSIKSGYTDSYKGLVANYLAQSANPEKLNQLKMAGTAITRMEIIRKIAAPSV